MRIPILQLENVLLASIQTDLEDDDAILFQNDVVAAISEQEALGLVIDITALDVVDSFMARVINDTGRMASLLGAEVVVCGIRPAVALTLVEMGRELIGVDTTFTLDQGMNKVKQKINMRGDSLSDYVGVVTHEQPR